MTERNEAVTFSDLGIKPLGLDPAFAKNEKGITYDPLRGKRVKLPERADWKKGYGDWVKGVTHGEVWGRDSNDTNTIIVTLLLPDGRKAGHTVAFSAWELIAE